MTMFAADPAPPRSAKEACERRAAARGRMGAAGRAGEEAAERRAALAAERRRAIAEREDRREAERTQARVAERRLPGFVRACGGGPIEPGIVLDALGETLSGPRYVDAAAYWLLGLTPLTPEEVEALLSLRPGEAAAAACGHARRERLPTLDLQTGQ